MSYMPHNMIALIDCNNFYVACERLFQPSLRHVPMVVLSNHDACIIARSNEAKALHIPMGGVYAQYRDYMRQHHVHVMRSNYPLYADLSSRFSSFLRQVCGHLERYSIDEVFIPLSDEDPSTLYAWGYALQQRIEKVIGLPTSLGIARTKTLAKCANHEAKRQGRSVCVLSDDVSIHTLLHSMDVNSLWGIGRRLGQRLHALNIQTAWDFHQSHRLWVHRSFGIDTLKTWEELHGTVCLPFHITPRHRQSIRCYRSMGQVIHTWAPIRAALTNHVSEAASKARKYELYASTLTVLLRPVGRHHGRASSLTVALPQATSHTTVLLKYSVPLLARLYHHGTAYRACGIILSDLSAYSTMQHGLFGEQNQRADAVMATVDAIAQKMGSGHIQWASGLMTTASKKRLPQSPGYTTQWDALLTVR